jgi:hypothetical protein
MILDCQCDHCRHHIRSDGKLSLRCAAFPDGIPPQMMTYNARLKLPHDHRQPYPGDNGIRFEPLLGKRHPLDIAS